MEMPPIPKISKAHADQELKELMENLDIRKREDEYALEMRTTLLVYRRLGNGELPAPDSTVLCGAVL